MFERDQWIYIAYTDSSKPDHEVIAHLNLIHYIKAKALIRIHIKVILSKKIGISLDSCY